MINKKDLNKLLDKTKEMYKNEILKELEDMQERVGNQEQRLLADARFHLAEKKMIEYQTLRRVIKIIELI